MKRPIDGTMFHGDAGRVSAKVIPVFPIRCGSNGPGTKASTAIRADISQTFNARAAKRAFERTNHCDGRIGRKWHVAVFASRS